MWSRPEPPPPTIPTPSASSPPSSIAGIRAVSPDFPDVETWLALDQAAQIALSRPDDPDPSLEARADLARRLGRAAPEEQAAVRRDVGRYLTTLAGLQLTDADVIAPTSPRRLLRSAFWIGVLVLLLGGLVAATALVNVWPAAVVVAVSLLVKTPVSKGTARVARGPARVPHRVDHVRRAGHRRVRAGDRPRRDGRPGSPRRDLDARARDRLRMLLRWQAQRERIGTVGLAEAVRAEAVDTVWSVAGPS